MPSKSHTKNKPPTFTQLLIMTALATGLDDLTRNVAQSLGMPDFNTSRGLKTCHESFKTISSTLNNVFDQSREHTSNRVNADHLAAAVLAIYGCMAGDTLLRQRVFSEAHFVEKAATLLHSQSAGTLVMEILRDIARVPDPMVLVDVARLAGVIVDCMEHNLRRAEFVEDAVCVLSHVTTAVLRHVAPSSQLLFPIPTVLEFMLRAVRLPDSTETSFTHLLSFCLDNTRDHATIFLSNPDSVDFLVACTRGPDIETRVSAQRALINLYAPGHTDIQQEHFDAGPKPAKLAQTQRVLDEYYRTGSESFSAKYDKERRQLLALIQEFATSSQCSHLELGQKLANLVLENESLVRDHLCTTPELAEMLSVCEVAVRDSLSNTAGVTADILRLEILLGTGEQRKEVINFALGCLQRHGSIPFFHYILAEPGCKHLQLHTIQTVLCAEKGLECAASTEFVRKKLLFYSALASYSIIVAFFQLPPAQVPLPQVNALMDKASVNAKAFIDLVPIDDPDVPLMSALVTYVDLLKKGHTWTEKSFQSSGKKFSFICDLACCTDHGLRSSEGCVALCQIFSRMPAAWKIWGSTVSRQPRKYYTQVAGDVDPDAGAALIAWLEELDATPPGQCLRDHLRGIDPETHRYGPARLRACVACGHNSVVLKKCARCQKVRYCNSECQRKHWKIHRDACKVDTGDG